MEKYIGLDIGGTNIRVGMLDENNELVYQDKYENQYGNDIKSLMSKIISSIENIDGYDDASSIGLSVAGSVDILGNKVITSKNVSALINYPIKDVLNKIFNKPIYMENDAKVAAYGEALQGFGKKYKTVCYITISTGLGGGLVIDKQIYRGANNFGSYIPRIYLDGYNTADNLLSSRVLLQQAQEKISNNIDSTKDLFDLYAEGNPKAVEIIESFKHYLTILLLNISATFNPDVIILGGGVVKSKDLFLKDVLTEYYHMVHPLAKYTIVTTQSLEEPGLIGACLLGKNNYVNKKTSR